MDLENSIWIWIFKIEREITGRRKLLRTIMKLASDPANEFAQLNL
jgi:hypothetical protein